MWYGGKDGVTGHESWSWLFLVMVMVMVQVVPVLAPAVVDAAVVVTNVYNIRVT